LSIIAGSAHFEDAAAVAERAARRPALLQPAAIGALLAAALVLALGWWFASQARVERAEDAWNRAVIMQLMALGEAAAALEGRDGPTSEAALQQLLLELDSGDGYFRIVRLSGSRLLASTASGDRDESAAPRRLSRDEKWLFDLGQALRAAVETNVSEGVFRRRQVHIERWATSAPGSPCRFSSRDASRASSRRSARGISASSGPLRGCRWRARWRPGWPSPGCWRSAVAAERCRILPGDTGGSSARAR
jgi:hypothetical protein